MEGDSEKQWSRLPSPMSLKIFETNKTDLFIAASLDFFGVPMDKMAKNHKGSLYYKIEVNGEPIVQYHVSNPRDSKKLMGVNLHAKAKVPAGENTIEVLYKVSKNGSWDLMRYQSQRQLSVLALPAV